MELDGGAPAGVALPSAAEPPTPAAALSQPSLGSVPLEEPDRGAGPSPAQFVAALHPEDQAPGAVFIFRARDSTTLRYRHFDDQARAEVDRQCTGAENLYAKVCRHDLARDPEAGATSSGTGRSAVSLGAVWADFDVRGPAHEKETLPATVEEVLGFSRELLPFAPSFTLWTGHGLAVAWLLAEALDLTDDEERFQADKLLSRFARHVNGRAGAKGWKFDNVFKLASQIRIPGTWNVKGGRRELVETLSWMPGRRYSAEELLDYFPGADLSGETGDHGATVARRRSEYSGPEIAPEFGDVVSRCRFVRELAEDVDGTDYDEWFSLLTLVKFTTGGEELALSLSAPRMKSRGHDRRHTLSRLRSIKGPIRCAKIEEAFGPERCQGCTFREHRQPRGDQLVGPNVSPLYWSVLERMGDGEAQPALEPSPAGEGAPPETSPPAGDTVAEKAELLAQQHTDDSPPEAGDGGGYWLTAEQLLTEKGAAPETHLRNGFRLIRRHGAIMAFARGPGWHVYDGRRWDRNEEAALRLAQRIPLYVRREAEALYLRHQQLEVKATQIRTTVELPSLEEGRGAKPKGGEVSEPHTTEIAQAKKDAGSRFKWAVSSAMGSNIRESLGLARAQLAVPVERFDAEGMLLNCQNGTIDLRTGEFRAHRREDYLTKLSPVTYDPQADCPLYREHLELMFPDNPDVQRYVQKVAGSCLVAQRVNRSFFMFVGDGGTGKNALTEPWMDVLGEEYSMAGNPSIVIETEFEQHPTMIASLWGKRMVLFDETKRKERRRLEVEQIKRLTGSRRVRAHFMRQDEFDFEITSTFILLSNNLPAVEDSSNGIWDRLKLVVCRHRIADQLAKLGRKPDEDVGLKLRAELPGILNFMVQGCRLWLEEGLGAPVDVLQATTDYKRQANSVLSWRDDVLEAGGEMLANLARKSYEVYCQNRGLVPVRRNDFKMELKQAGMECTRPDGKPLRDAQGRHLYAGYSLPFAEVERLHREGGADDGGADAAN